MEMNANALLNDNTWFSGRNAAICQVNTVLPERGPPHLLYLPNKSHKQKQIPNL